ncbi:hypothetical protein GWK47_005731 [Chionoecetes opilio]|uniref:Uncharacterized protein n=1 Tax=Chionoecetes opilio TaxID=41210 RepID=A0A8J4YAF7_CHIOP|nr:hypothetical protein GWK47_005731 [Chionoecetes opilio]
MAYLRGYCHDVCLLAGSHYIVGNRQIRRACARKISLAVCVELTWMARRGSPVFPRRLTSPSSPPLLIVFASIFYLVAMVGIVSTRFHGSPVVGVHLFCAFAAVPPPKEKEDLILFLRNPLGAESLVSTISVCYPDVRPSPVPRRGSGIPAAASLKQAADPIRDSPRPLSMLDVQDVPINPVTTPDSYGSTSKGACPIPGVQEPELPNINADPRTPTVNSAFLVNLHHYLRHLTPVQLATYPT